MEESTALCTNCQRPIAASNFVIHSLHCQRNLTKCEKCGEAVPRSAMDEHESEYHSKVNCPDCRVSIEKSDLETHKKLSCRSRQVHCPYCELELPATEIFDHENYCGSRTKKCDECGEYVMLKYEKLHLESNHTFLKLDDEPGPTWIKNDFESSSSRPAKSNNNKKPQLNTGKFDIGDDDEADDMQSLFANLMKKKKVIGTTPHYPGVAYPLSGVPQRTVSRSPPPYQEVMDDSSDLVALPCEFCEAMIPVNQLILHQTACRMDLTSLHKIKNNPTESRKKYTGLVPNDSDNEAEDEESRPELKSMNEFVHPRRRDIGSYVEARRNAIDEGSVGRRANRGGLSKSAVDGNEATLRTEDDDGIYLPCEFCCEGYPPSLLLDHQEVCEYRLRNNDEVPEVRPDSKESSDRFDSATPKHTRSNKFDEDTTDSMVMLNQLKYNSGASGKSNMSNSYNDLHGNFTVASEWSDDSDSRPTSATGAIPKQKAGKLNISRKVNQEVQSSRPSNSVTNNHSKVLTEKKNSYSERSPKYRIRNNLKDHNGADDDGDDDE